ncbi:MAG: MBL fold metallo-hydrolase [Anaerolineae bacterium]|nr:MBL fold metallo-hydrolase [Anaerolineae bacterium]
MNIKYAVWLIVIVALMIGGVIPVVAQDGADAEVPVMVRLIGHSSFMIVAPDGTRLVVDPYGGLSYPFPTGVEADVVVLSHTQHNDHTNYRAIEGDPLLIKRPDLEPQQVGMIDITAHIGRHGLWQGQSMGANSVIVFQIGDVKLVHLGETGLIEDEAVLEAISDADVVFVPVGAGASLAPEEVMPLMETIRARTIVPQHYAPDAEHRYYDCLTVEEFLDAAQPDLPVVEAGDLAVTAEMPAQIVVMESWGFTHEVWEPLPVGEPVEDAGAEAGDEAAVQIEFLGRASFLIIAPDGYRFVLDPHFGLPYDFPTGIEADAVVISHVHSDHSAYWLVEGSPTLVMEHDPVTFGMTTITGYPSIHGQYDGMPTDEPNTVYVLQIGDVKLVHLGAFGSLTTDEGHAAVQDADVVFMPVGVMTGLPYDELFPFIDEIGARTRVPMHWFVPEEGFGATLATFIQAVEDDPGYVEQDVLTVTPGMPEQIVLLTQQED